MSTTYFLTYIHIYNRNSIPYAVTYTTTAYILACNFWGALGIFIYNSIYNLFTIAFSGLWSSLTWKPYFFLHRRFGRRTSIVEIWDTIYLAHKESTLPMPRNPHSYSTTLQLLKITTCFKLCFVVRRNTDRA